MLDNDMQSSIYDRGLSEAGIPRDNLDCLTGFAVSALATGVAALAYGFAVSFPMFLGFAIAIGGGITIFTVVVLPPIVRSTIVEIVAAIRAIHADLIHRVSELRAGIWRRRIEVARTRQLESERKQLEINRRNAEIAEIDRIEAERRLAEQIARSQRDAERVRRESARVERQLEETARIQWSEWHARPLMESLDQMNGRDFEQFLIRLLVRMGYTEVAGTPINDFGADIIAVDPKGFKVAIQAKRWKGNVGVAAVQECIAGIKHYRCDGGMVVTTGRITKRAQILADECVELCDRTWVADKITRHMTDPPPFSWDAFNELRDAINRVSAAPDGGVLRRSEARRRRRSKRKSRRQSTLMLR